MATPPLEVEFRFFKETQRTYIYQQPRHKNTALASLQLYILKGALPGKPNAIKVTIEEGEL